MYNFCKLLNLADYSAKRMLLSVRLLAAGCDFHVTVERFFEDFSILKEIDRFREHISFRNCSVIKNLLVDQ